MSGVEAIAVLSIIASVTQLVQFSTEAIERIHSFCDDVDQKPKGFREIHIVLPLIANTLLKTRDHAKNADLDESTCKSLRIVIEGCHEKISELHAIMKKVLPAASDSKFRRSWKAVVSVKQDKRAEEIATAIWRYMDAINHCQTAETVSHASNAAQMVADLTRRLDQPSALSTEPHQPSPLQPERYFMVPTFWSEDFTGRKDMMKSLESKLSVPDKHCRVALVGLGGIGKTRVALEYAYKYKESKDVSIFWVHASSSARVNKSFLEIARTAKLPECDDPQSNKIELVKEWLEGPRSGNWLLIIDNADDVRLIFESERLVKSFPRSNKGSILLTTRDWSVGVKFAAQNCVPIAPLTLEESESLLAARLTTCETTADERKDLGRELSCVPLALIQASAFITTNSLSISEYLELYRGSETACIDLLSEDFEDDVRDEESENPVATTWHVSFEHIRQHFSMAADVLSIMSMLDAQAVPESLLPFEHEPVLFKKALGTLQAFSLISARQDKIYWEDREDKCYDLHRLVRLATRSWLSLTQQHDLWMAKALKAVSERFPPGLWQYKDRWTVYLPHASVLLTSPRLRFPEDESLPPVITNGKSNVGKHAEEGEICPICMATLAGKLADSYEATGEILLYMRSSKHALTLTEFSYGEDNLATFAALDRVALAAKSLLDYSTAVNAGLKAVEGKRKMLGPEHPSTLTSMSNLAITYRPMGHFEKAKETHLQILPLRRKTLGAYHAQTLETLNNLATAEREQGLFKEAEDIERECLTGRTQTLGPYHPKTLQSKSCLGWLYFYQGFYEQASKLNSEALHGCTEYLGPRHPQTLRAMAWQGWILAYSGNYDAAKSLAQEVFSLRATVYGSDHPYTVNCKAQLAWIHTQQNELEKAETMCKEVIAFREKRLTEATATDVYQAKSDLAAIYSLRGWHHRAVEIKEAVVEARIKTRGNDHFHTLRCTSSLGGTYIELHRLDDAATLLLPAWAKQKGTLGEAHPDTLMSMTRVSLLYHRQGDVAKGLKTLEDAVRFSSERLGPSHPKTMERTRLLDRLSNDSTLDEKSVIIAVEEPHVER